MRNQSVPGNQHSEKKGTKTAPFFAKRGAVLQNSTPMHTGALFMTNMIIKEKTPL